MAITCNDRFTIKTGYFRPGQVDAALHALFVRLVVWMVGLAGLKLLAAGCRAIPAGHLDFDPELAKRLNGDTGRDGVTLAIIHQKVMGWQRHNEQQGRNLIDGQHWTYNSERQWARELADLWHFKTVGKHLRALEVAGLLVSMAAKAAKGDQTKWYSAGNQMRLWEEQKTPMGGASCGDDSSISKPAITKPAKSGTKTTTPARARDAVAEFRPPSEDGELAEKNPERPEVPEQRADVDPYTSEETPNDAGALPPPPVAPPPSPAAEHADIYRRFRRHLAAIPARLIRDSGAECVRAWLKYADARPTIQNPPGFVNDILTDAPGEWPPGVEPETSGKSYLNEFCVNYDETRDVAPTVAA